MPSITWWNRLEPRPRSHTVADTLSARVRDAAWMLARQWQIGEYKGTDSGSPAYSQYSANLSRIVGWRPQGQATLAYDGRRVPLEEVVTSEPFGDDLALRVELGQSFEQSLTAADPSGTTLRLVRPLLVDHYGITEISDNDLGTWADQSAARFVRVCGNRAADGVGLLEALASDFDGVTTTLRGNGGDRGVIEAALHAFEEASERVYGSIGRGDAPAWHPERLDYAVEVVAADSDGNGIVLAATPDRDTGFDWSAFDIRPTGDPDFTIPARSVEQLREAILPGQVRFRGMPTRRWWDFETNVTDFGDIKPDRNDLGRLAAMEFMLVHSNDWFVIPFDQPVGTLATLEWLIVHDVFGIDTLVKRADLDQLAEDRRWSMFSTSIEGEPATVAPFFLLPSSAAITVQASASVEEVRFFRDEMANMAWAVEHLAEDELGQPRPGHERDLANHPPPEVAPSGDDATLQYLIQTRIPEHWLPLIPVSLNPLTGEIAFELGRAQRVRPDGSSEHANPRGRVLQPSGAGPVYRIREEEVPRAGLRVSRVVQRTRWIDGTTHLWIARHKQPGAGEGSSGLRFDQALRAGEPA